MKKILFVILVMMFSTDISSAKALSLKALNIKSISSVSLDLGANPARISVVIELTRKAPCNIELQKLTIDAADAVKATLIQPLTVNKGDQTVKVTLGVKVNLPQIMAQKDRQVQIEGCVKIKNGKPKHFKHSIIITAKELQKAIQNAL